LILNLPKIGPIPFNLVSYISVNSGLQYCTLFRSER